MNSHASNPVNPWINGSETKEFTYKYGDTPFHVFMKAQSHIVQSLMIFADSTTHVIDILTAMAKHLRECNAIYEKNAKSQYKESFMRDHDKVAAGIEQGIKDYLEGDFDRCDIQELYKGQAYKIGWASNDTI